MYIFKLCLPSFESCRCSTAAHAQSRLRTQSTVANRFAREGAEPERRYCACTPARTSTRCRAAEELREERSRSLLPCFNMEPLAWGRTRVRTIDLVRAGAQPRALIALCMPKEQVIFTPCACAKGYSNRSVVVDMSSLSLYPQKKRGNLNICAP